MGQNRVTSGAALTPFLPTPLPLPFPPSHLHSFYNPVAFKKLGVECIKIPCLGREGAPDTEAVNRFCYTASQVYATMVERNQCILVHCTHGYNRTGFMIVSYWLRYHLTVPYMSVAVRGRDVCGAV